MLVRETAAAIADLDLDPAGLVVACRRIVERHPTSGPLWWLCASLLAANDPFREAWGLADHVDDDPTPGQLVQLLPDDATVCIIGWPDLVGEALVRRGDATVLVIDTNDEGSSLVRRLQRSDVQAEAVPAAGVAAGVAASDLVIIEAVAAGPDGALCALGSHAAAAVAYCSEVPVWLVAGRGRRLPEPMWRVMCERLAAADDGWSQPVELVPLALATGVLGADGLLVAAAGALAAECPMAHELLRMSAM
ncbi:unannotated protein [freshwater metagenome]|uniref:Unannotated protein n=1 Tax=freshwater metagenome TaxID=449393 RepID=A0A6J7DUW7_9ZZZZ